jgi:hypothetical protein
VSVNRTGCTAGMAFAVVAAGLLFLPPGGGAGGSALGPFSAQAQNFGERVVMGDVVDARSSPVSGATVFLKSLKSKSIRSFTSTAKGRFQFSQVNMTEDYELWAEKDGRKTATKTVSSWDARKAYETELKMK